MKLKRIHIIVALVAFFLTMISCCLGSVFLYKEYQKREIVSTACKWANLNSIPESADIKLVEGKGTSFSRQLQVTFTAPEEDVRKWLEVSPGTKGVVPQVSDTVEVYDIKPAGGAQYAKLKYNPIKSEVFIEVYWS